MAKTPPAAAAAPVLDQAVEEPVDGDGAPKKRFSLKLPAFMARLPRLKLPFRVVLSKKLIIFGGSAVLTLGVAVGAAIAFWPADAPPPEKPVVAKKSKKAKAAKEAASAAVAAASGASLAQVATAAASAPAEAVAESHAASGPEDPMDKLRRRLGETLSNGKLDSSGPGELRVTARQGEPKAAAAPRAGHAQRADAHTAEPALTAVRAVERSAPHGAARIAAGQLDEHGAPQGTRSGAAGSHDVRWSYDGAGGPAAWARLKPEFAKCATGARQSPIDIRDGIQVNLDPIQFDYKPSAFRVIDNGHTVQVNVAPGNFIEANGRRFELMQFHFHRPSEERIDGKQFDMVAHLVHKDADGKIAVVAVLLERGSAQGVIQSVWNNLPLEKGEEQAARVPIDLSQLLPAERHYFTYMGSLTTPPCSEGVLWMVMKKPVQIAPEQIGIFARMYPMNARPLQSASGRMIKESSGP